MKEVITYSLLGDNNSDRYYQDISVFTDSFLTEAYQLASPIVEAYSKYMLEYGNETLSTKDEYIFEFLMLGTLWQVYSGDASGLEEGPRQFLTGLSELRQHGGILKPGIDFLKGVLSTVFLSPDLDDNTFILEPNLENLEKLLYWLTATGEFNQEVKRLLLWQEFLKKQRQEEASDYLATAITLAGWFEIRSNEHIGHYTHNVDSFLIGVRPSHYWREDVIFSGRRRVEYHLNMIGAEIMNRANRDSFIKAKFKAILLPSCMCKKPIGQCMAQECSNGLQCMLCTPSCQVRRLTELGSENGFKVYIITHESSAFSGSNGIQEQGDTMGIVGIACVLNLISGGWKAKNLGLPAQCVLLDYCGCKKHWHETGLVTDINMNQLKKILMIE